MKVRSRGSAQLGPSDSSRSVMRIATSVGAAFAMILSVLIAFVGPAHAASLNVDVDNARLTDVNGDPLSEPLTFNAGDQARFAADWNIEGNINAGDSFAVTLPEALRLTSAKPFELTGDDGNPIATCTYELGTDPQNINCVFTGGPYDGASGDIWFRVTFNEELEETDLEWTVGNNVVVTPGVTVGPKPGTSAPDSIRKSGSARSDENVIYWEVKIPAGNGSTFTITDLLSSESPNRPHEFLPEKIRLSRFAVAADGTFDPNAREDLFDTDPATATPDFPHLQLAGTPLTAMNLTVTGLDDSYYHVLYYQTRAQGGTVFPGDTFANTARVNNKEFKRTLEAVAYGGGGGNPRAYVTFSLAKSLQGDASNRVDVDSFVVKATSGDQNETINVPADGTRVSAPYFRSGNPITLTEVLPQIEGVTWGDVAISGDGVSDNGDGTFSINPDGGASVDLTITNTANPASGQFAITKTVTGDEAVVDRAKDTTFTVNYTVDGEAASEPLTVAHGKTTTSPSLPYGAKITLSEEATIVDGVRFGEPVFSTSEFTIGDGTTIEVALENPVTELPPPPKGEVPPPEGENPPPGETPEPPPGPPTPPETPGKTPPNPGGHIPAAGAPIVLMPMAVAAFLLAGGAWLARRREDNAS